MRDVEHGDATAVEDHSRPLLQFRSETPTGLRVADEQQVLSASPKSPRRIRAKTVTLAGCKKCGNSKRPTALSVRQPRNHLASKGLCANCATSSDKLCAMSHYCRSETTNQMHWGSGLCDTCYNLFPQCKVCARRLKVTEVRFRTGLCDGCYDSCGRSCHKCNEKLTLGQMGWRTGMCDNCFNSSTKTCQLCQTPIAPEELGWRTGFCDKCYAEQKGCTATVLLGRELCQACSSHRKRECVRCDCIIPDDELRWSSGLCDECYKDTQKNCSTCTKKIPLRQLRWRSGVCDKCYNERPHRCQMCKSVMQSSKVLCDHCFDALTSKGGRCSRCQMESIHVGDPFWSIGLCSHCYLNGGPRLERERASSLDQIYVTPKLAADGGPPLFSLIYSDKANALKPNVQITRPDRLHQLIFLLVGVSGWFTSNITFAALPLLVEALPQGAALASICNMSTQAGAIFSMTYFCIQAKRREDGKPQAERSPRSPRGDHKRFDKLAKERELLRRKKEEELELLIRKKEEKKTLMQSVLITHAGQLLAVSTMFLFALYWRFRQDVSAIVVLAALTGVVGNMADLTVWPISMQYPGCAVAIQVGGTLSGVLSNYLEVALGMYGISNLFVFAGLMQFLLWLPLFYVTGRPKVRKGITRPSIIGHCNCIGCDGCVSITTPTSPKSLSKNSNSPFRMNSLTNQSRSRNSAMSSLYMPLVVATSSISSEVSPLARSFARGGADACTGFKQALALESSGAKTVVLDDIYLQRICCLGTFVVKAAGYSLPSLFPYLVLPYVGKQWIYQNVNTCYNSGNLIGRMLVQFYTVGKWTRQSTCICICITFLFILVSAYDRQLEAELVPPLIAWWAIPAIVGILNLSAGLLSTGLMAKANERACEKNCPPSMKNLPPTMGFYGQFGCVTGNVIVYLAAALHLI